MKKVAVVTGGNRNIGAAISIGLAEAGFSVAINCKSVRYQDEAEAVAKAINLSGGMAATFQADVASTDEVSAMFKQIADKLGSPEVLINNAAASVASNMPWDEITEEEWDSVMATNLKGVFLCARAASTFMREAGGGAIVNISTIRVPLGKTGNLHYTASKAGILGFTRTLARELGPLNIRVNSLLPGAIQTPDERKYGSVEEVDAAMIAEQSLKRRGLPSDIASAAVFLSTPAASFITGQSLIVDGGWVMS
jgi:3-oxoacyl-[acyl-carrier protein] reductase